MSLTLVRGTNFTLRLTNRNDEFYSWYMLVQFVPKHHA